MIWLLLSILFSSGIFLIFKVFESLSIRTFPAIVTNYGAAVALGVWAMSGSMTFKEAEVLPLFYPLLGIGLVFITIFYLMALTAQKLGVSVSSVAAKMALAVPVIVFPLIDGNEPFGWLHVLGLLLALTGVYLASAKGEIRVTDKRLMLLPVLVFLGSGVIDCTLGYYSNTLDSPVAPYLMTTLPFSSAFVVGLIFSTGKAVKSGQWIKLREFLGGIVLGIINFGSIYFLVRAISDSPFSRTFIFPINNMGIILLSSAASMWIFKEYFSRRNKWGILLCLVAIMIFFLGETSH